MDMQVTSSEIALFLDFDGVLVDIAATPDAVEVDPDLPSILTGAHTAFKTRLAIVTGRNVHDIRGFLHNIDVPIYGSHGAELAIGETVERLVEPPSDVANLTEACADFCADHPTLSLERKPFGPAIHYRADPPKRTIVHDFLDQLAARTASDVVVQQAKFAYELKPKGATKRAALADAMARFGWSPARPIHIGDDVTDESAFEIAQSMGGFGVKVGEGESIARYRLPAPSDVKAHLQRWSDRGDVDFDQS
ncbi:trehalose-phosphatase [Gymnodinialimonas sp. 2305UL16-5]|uniref:trehalose-phosphatase n=1 Tax=Gymnodinialimonas mytili TaxID=3126503 RepID=UPI00309DF666